MREYILSILGQINPKVVVRAKHGAIELSSFSQCWQQGRHCRSPPLPPVLVYAYSNDSTSGALVINGGRVSGTLLKLHYKDA